MTPNQMRQKAAEYHAQAKALSPRFRAAIKARTTPQGAREYNQIGDEMSRLDKMGFDLEKEADILESKQFFDSLLNVAEQFKSISRPNKIYAINALSDRIRSGKI